MSTHLLVCLPFAGAGASFYRNEQAPAGVDLLPIQLPGREERFADDAYPDLAAAVADIAAQIHRSAAPGQRILLLGHSFGAILAFELARTLGSVVDHVYVSGSPDPWNPRAERAAGLTDDEFVAQVETFAGYTHPTLAHPELRQIILPALRSDVTMHESYVAAPDAVISAPITALRGTDDVLVAEADLNGWKRATTGEFSLRMFAGGHMYLADALTETLEFIAAAARVSHG